MPARKYITCTLPDCERPHYGKGLCRMHYLRQYKNGTTDMIRKRNTCTIEGCNLPVKGHGLCGTHYIRWYTGSENTGPITPISGTLPFEKLPEHLTRDQWLIWAAGFFDGEGCISIIQHKSTLRRYLQVTAAQADLRPLRILQALFGGRLKPHKQSTNRPVFFWTTSCRQASNALSEMLPYLVVKKDQADCALEFSATIGLGRKATPELRQQREEFRKRLAALKQVRHEL